MAVTSHDGGLTGGSIGIDQDTDLALLDQHLLKTNALSQRMTTILSQLDSRLSRLDKSIAPLGIRELTRQTSNLDAVLDILAPGSRPQPARGGSFGAPSSVNGSFEGGGGGSAATTPLALVPPSNPFGMSHSKTFGSFQESRDKVPRESPSPSNVMDRGRAIPRPDILPRWTDGKGASTPTRKPSHNAVDSPASVASPTAPWQAQAETGNEREILARGPDLMSLSEYFSAMSVVIADLEQMHQGLMDGRGGTREAGVIELSNELGEAYTSLAQLLRKTIREMPKPFDPSSLIGSNPPVTVYYPQLSSVKPLSSKMAAIVYPEVPTPKSTSILEPILNECIDEMAGVRGEWLRNSLSGLAWQIDEVDGDLWEGRGGEKVKLVTKLWESFIAAAEMERSVSATLMPGPPGKWLLAQTLSSGQGVLASTMKQVIATIKKSLSTQTMVLLDLFAALLQLQPRYESSMESILGHDAGEVETAMQPHLSALRSLALRSFPERLVDIRAGSRDAPQNEAIDETTHSTLAYLEALPSFGNMVEGLLRSSGHAERSWLMGMNQPPSTARNAEEEGGIVNLYAADVLGTLISHLETRAKMMRPPTSWVYLLNNLSHIRNTTSSFTSDIIGPGAEDMLNKRFRDAKSHYLAEWTGLTNLLQHQAEKRFGVSASSHDKQSTKEASALFFARLEELAISCRQHPLSRADPDLRDRVGREVEEAVRPAYQTWYNRAQAHRYDKYLKQSPEEISRRVIGMFR